MIIDRVEQIVKRLNKINSAESERKEANNLHSLSSELSDFADPIHQLVQNQTVLENEGVKIPKAPGIGSVLENVRKVSKDFAAKPKSTTIRVGKRWPGLTTKLSDVINIISNNQKSAWKDYFLATYFSGQAPHQRKTQLADIPENKKALAQYEKLYSQFNQYRSKMPTNTGEFGDLRRLSEQLASIEFDENVPQCVMKFLTPARYGGASLDLLTPEVISWLRERKSFNDYVIKEKYDRAY